MGHTYADEGIAEWFGEKKYHPQSAADGKALCEFFVEDLAIVSDDIREAFRDGELVYSLNQEVGPDQLTWDIDLVVGPPAEGQSLLGEPPRLSVTGKPKEIWLATDAKAIMTAHQKAQKNRARNVFSMAATLKELAGNQEVNPAIDRGVLSTGLAVVNMSEQFSNPNTDSIKTHHDIDTHAERTFDLFRLTVEKFRAVYGIGCIAVDVENTDDHTAEFVTRPPAPQHGDIIQYRRFLRDVADEFELQFL